MELVLIAIIAVIGNIVGAAYILQKMQHNKMQWLEAKQDYEKDLFQLKKKESRKDKKLAATINTTAPKTKIEGAKDIVDLLQNPAVKDIIDTLKGGAESEEENDILTDLLKNPAIQGVIGEVAKNYTKPKDQAQDQVFE